MKTIKHRVSGEDSKAESLAVLSRNSHRFRSGEFGGHSSRECEPVSEEITDVATIITDGSQGAIIGHISQAEWNIHCDTLRTVVGNVQKMHGVVSENG
ncbi:hypothetical protein TNCV_2021461 [Trichonephila clavipes]|nr:hypothetical protein TNCV_2021461 [Trichonephila clavipes]